MSKPWHKRWHGNALNGTRALSLELRGAYQTLQDLMYDAWGPIRLEERRICGEFDCDVRVFRRVIGGLIAAGKIRLWTDGTAVWVVNDKVLEQTGSEGWEAGTSAELPAEVREKFAIATRQLSPKSGGKPNKNSGGDEISAAKNAPQKKRKEEEPPKPPQGAGLFDLDPVTQSPEEAAQVAKPEEYPAAFELAWKAYPHVKGRSSKPKALGFWRRLDPALRTALPSACARYAREGREPKMDCGAPAMERWLRDRKFADWIEDPASAPPQAPTFNGPPEIRAAVVAAEDEAFARTYLDPCRWRNGPDRVVIARTGFAAGKIRDAAGQALARLNVRVVVETVGG